VDHPDWDLFEFPRGCDARRIHARVVVSLA
jgi:hypothetical protein